MQIRLSCVATSLLLACGPSKPTPTPAVAVDTAAPEPAPPDAAPAPPDAAATPAPDAAATPTPDAAATPTPDAAATPTPDAAATPAPDAAATPTPDAAAAPALLVPPAAEPGDHCAWLTAFDPNCDEDKNLAPAERWCKCAVRERADGAGALGGAAVISYFGGADFAPTRASFFALKGAAGWSFMALPIADEIVGDGGRYVLTSKITRFEIVAPGVLRAEASRDELDTMPWADDPNAEPPPNPIPIATLTISATWCWLDGAAPRCAMLPVSGERSTVTLADNGDVTSRKPVASWSRAATLDGTTLTVAAATGTLPKGVVPFVGTIALADTTTHAAFLAYGVAQQRTRPAAGDE